MLSADALERLARERKEQHDIVARIWRVLGSPSYEDLAGRDIYALDQEGVDAKADLATARARIAALEEGLKQALERVAYKPGDFPIISTKAEQFIVEIRALLQEGRSDV